MPRPFKFDGCSRAVHSNLLITVGDVIGINFETAREERFSLEKQPGTSNGIRRAIRALLPSVALHRVPRTRR